MRDKKDSNNKTIWILIVGYLKNFLKVLQMKLVVTHPVLNFEDKRYYAIKVRYI